MVHDFMVQCSIMISVIMPTTYPPHSSSNLVSYDNSNRTRSCYSYRRQKQSQYYYYIIIIIIIIIVVIVVLL